MVGRSGEKKSYREAFGRTCDLQLRDTVAPGAQRNSQEINTQTYSASFFPSPANVSHWSNPIRSQQAGEPFDAVHTGHGTERTDWRRRLKTRACIPYSVTASFWVVPLEGTEVPSPSPFLTRKKEYGYDGRSSSSPFRLHSESHMLRVVSNKIARI